MHLMALGAFSLLQKITSTRRRRVSLNAPYDARCFLTDDYLIPVADVVRLNAPYDARCFLTR